MDTSGLLSEAHLNLVSQWHVEFWEMSLVFYIFLLLISQPIEKYIMDIPVQDGVLVAVDWTVWFESEPQSDFQSFSILKGVDFTSLKETCSEPLGGKCT